MRHLVMAYSVACYAAAVGALVFLIEFISECFSPITVNAASPVSPELPVGPAIVANTILILLWGAQHSVMADPRFKAWWRPLVPQMIERSTYLLCVAASTLMLIFFWSPIPIMLWDVMDTPLGTALLVGYYFGWVIVLFATFLINHFHLFGLEQAYRHWSGTSSAASVFVTPVLYRVVRHPMMMGVLISLWCAPSMSVGRLLFNVVMTAYILVGTRHEEETLVSELGDVYETYRKTTPMLLPRFAPRKPAIASEAP